METTKNVQCDQIMQGKGSLLEYAWVFDLPVGSIDHLGFRMDLVC